jgi:putative redox protein
MSDGLKVRLERVGPAAFEAEAGSGGGVIVDGAPKIGGEGRGMRPMELLLTSLASCSAMDVVHILRRQKEPLEDLRIEVEGTRADAVPAVFTAIHLRFTATGAVSERKLQRAVALSVEKYCSVRSSLAPEVEVTYEARLAP